MDCGKCYGNGFLNYHLNIADGICFACKGTGKIYAGKDTPARS